MKGAYEVQSVGMIMKLPCLGSDGAGRAQQRKDAFAFFHSPARTTLSVTCSYEAGLSLCGRMSSGLCILSAWRAATQCLPSGTHRKPGWKVVGAGKRDTGCRVFEILGDVLNGPDKSDNLQALLEAGTVSLCQLGRKVDLGTSLPE